MFGPMSLLLLLSIWATVLIIGFALLQERSRSVHARREMAGPGS